MNWILIIMSLCTALCPLFCVLWLIALQTKELEARAERMEALAYHAVISLQTRNQRLFE